METPRRAADGFIAAVDQADYERAADYIDVRYLRGSARSMEPAELARRLAVIMQRGTWRDLDDLVDAPEGALNDGLPEYRDSIGVLEHGDELVRLYLQRVPGENGQQVWKVSNATLALVPELYQAYGYPEWIEDFRQRVPRVGFLGTELFKWLIVLGFGFVAYLACWVLSWLLLRSAIGRILPEAVRVPVARFGRGALGFWVATLMMTTTAGTLGRTATAETLRTYLPLGTLVTIWMLFVLVDLVRDLWGEYLLRQNRPATRVLLNPAASALKLLIFIGAGLAYLDGIGVDITTALAGLGVGGIAVALALQRPMEDVFGAFTLYAQQTMRIGDFCRIGDMVGTIEEITLRTTRVRTLQNSLINIPNHKLAAEPIDNISARQKILFRQHILLRQDTTAAQMRAVLEGIENLLRQNEKVLEDGARARFTRVIHDGLEVEVFAYIDTRDWPVFLSVGQELNLQTLEIVADAGARLVEPRFG